MIEKIQKAKQELVFILTVEVVLAIVIYMLFQDKQLLVMIGFVAIFNAILIIVGSRLFTHLEKNGTSIESTLKSDWKNAFMFGHVGMMTYDENHTITFQSDMFTDLSLDLVGKRLVNWQPILEEQFDNQEVLCVTEGEHSLEIYNNQDTGTLYVRDVTDFNELLHSYHEEQLVFGYLVVDNFEETVANVDEQRVALLQSSVRSALVEWANESGIILRRYRAENYFFVCEEKQYEKMLNDKFIILNRIRSFATAYHSVLGVSIGIGRHEKDLHQLERLAMEAFNLALSRGGDQVVVKSSDEPIRYFGGNSESKARTSHVKVRVVSQSIRGLFREASSIFIMGHNESDLDSLGASLALSKIANRYRAPVYVVVDPNSIEEKAKRAYQLLKDTGDYENIFVTPTRALELMGPSSLLCSVDNHRRALALSQDLIDATDSLLVIDHHRRGEDFVESPVLTYLEPAASSAVELVVEMFEYQDKPVELTDLEATILYAAILVDTSNFKNRVGVRTFRVAGTLREQGADMAHALELLEDGFELTMKKATLIQNAYHYNQEILVTAGNDDELLDRALLAKVGNDLMSIDGIEASFVIGKTGEDTIGVSARSNGKMNVQVVMEKMGGGGHFTMAACQINGKTINEVKLLLASKLKEFEEEREESEL